MTFLRACLKTVFFAVVILIYLGVGLIVTPLLALFGYPPAKLQKFRSNWVSRYSRIVAYVSGLKISVVGSYLTSLDPHQGVLIVANHVSYWDIIALSSVWPSSFVTSVELRGSGFLGALARLAGCIFVERRSRLGIRGEIDQMVNHLRLGQRVVLFPEGASGNGDRVLPFKSALFRAAVLAEVPVVSICIQYRMIDQQPVNSKNRDEIYYYGEQKFGAQFFKSMKLKQIEVVLEEAGVVAASKGSGNHKSIAAQSYESICSRFERIQS